MTKHYVLNLNPGAQYEWDRCTLRDPITADHPTLAELVAYAVGGESGSYLIAVNIEVEVLERTAAKAAPCSVAEKPDRPQVTHLAEVA